MAEKKYFGASLDRFIEASQVADRLTFEELKSGDMVTLITASGTEYTLVAKDPQRSRFTVQGGKYFSEPTLCTIAGCTPGGSMIQQAVFLKWFKLEIWPSKNYRAPSGSGYESGKPIVTSQIKEIWIKRASTQRNKEKSAVQRLTTAIRRRFGR